MRRPEEPTAGRYRLPNRDGSPHKGGWTRATNLASAISDTKALGDWQLRMALLGVREAILQTGLAPAMQAVPGPVRDLLTMDIERLAPGEIRGGLMAIAGEVQRLAKAELGATRGNLAHQMVEHHHAGLPQDQGVPSETLEKLPSYVTQLQMHCMTALAGMQERQVMVESLNVIGTLDNILHDALPPASFWASGVELCPRQDECADFIADLKTQKRFWSWLEICIQLALYAHGDAMWDKALGVWVSMPRVNQERALVAWMPWEHPAGEDDPAELHRVDMYEVDIVRGWEAAQQAFQVYNLRSAAKRKGNPWGFLRSIPKASLVEAYAQRLLSASTREEGSAVYREAKAAGVWGPELEATAAEILPRLK